MEPISDSELFAALEELRPGPTPAFAAELDARVAAGFPRESRFPSSSAALDWLRELKPSKVLLPAGAFALTAIIVATVVVSQNSGSGDSDTRLSRVSAQEPVQTSPGGGHSSPGAAAADSVGPQYETETPKVEEAIEDIARSQSPSGPASLKAFSAAGQNRAIERSAEITLGTEPENVGRASSEVFGVVHAYDGIVLNSRTSEGARAEARFELMIPSGKLGDAMAGFSEVAEVRSRHEATADITAPTVSAAEHLEDSRARIDSLLDQLAGAETEGEREAVERELREERRRAAALQASLDNLERRASLSRVSLRIVGGEGAISSDEGGAWGVGDAIDDAGQILSTGAAIALVCLAVLAPLALIALLIWLARRTYLRRARQTALG